MPMNPADISIPQGITEKWRGIVSIIAKAMKVPEKEQLPEDLRRSMEEMQGALEETERSQRVLLAILEDQKRMVIDLRNAYEGLLHAQEATIQQERLRALEQMASAIVHDINNALSPIVGFTDLLLIHESNLSDRARRYLDMIKTASMDIAHIVAQMRELYRKREGSETLSSVLSLRVLRIDDEPLLPELMKEIVK